jgi:hypothetical protein
MRAAAAAEHDRARAQRRGDSIGLLVERGAFDDGDLGIGQWDTSALGHRLATDAPRRRDAHEPGGERAPAAVALVPVAHRYGREGAAVRTASPE